jgi:serine/threonine protein kinase
MIRASLSGKYREKAFEPVCSDERNELNTISIQVEWMAEQSKGRKHAMNDGNIMTTTSLGRYRLLKQIGKGGMGEVWLGEDPRLHRQVAIKTLPVQKQQDNEFLLRFEREARAAAALNHPHILPIHDFGKQNLPDEEFITYIVMPYITGGTLADRIDKHDSNQTLMPQQEALAYLAQAAEAIDYAHKHGIVHRDIKPANMLLRVDNWLLLGDFGIARVLSNTENLTRTGVGTGTPEYIAPEQAQGRAEPASDIYSLAVLAYYLFTGKVPFKAISSYGTIVQHITSAPPPPRQINPTLSLQQEQALLHGLAKKATERPISACAMVEELRQATSSTSFPSSTPLVPRQTTPGPATSAFSRQIFPSHNPLPITGQSSISAHEQNSSASESAHTSQIREPFKTKAEHATQIQDPRTAQGARVSQSQATSQMDDASMPAKQQVSRRSLLIGGSAALTILAGGAGAWAFISNRQKPENASQPTPATTDPNGPDLILRGHTKPVTSLAWSAQSLLASASEDGSVLLWTPQQQQAARPSASARQTFHTTSPLLLSWSSDGQWLAIGNTGKGTTASLELYTSDLRKTPPGYSTAIAIPGTTAIAGLAWQNRYLTAVAAGEKPLQLHIWNTQEPQQQLDPITLTGSLSTTLSARSPLLLASPDSSLLALAETEGVIAGQIKLAGAATQWQQVLSPIKLDDRIKAISWMPSGTVMGALTTTNDQTFSLLLWTMQKKEQDPLSTDAILTTMAWSPAATSDLIATGSKDGQVLIWKYAGSNIPARLDSNLRAEVISLAWSPDGQWLAAGFNDKDASILVWNIQGRGF